MKWSEVLGFADAVRDHESNVVAERTMLARDSADNLVKAWKRAGRILAIMGIDELRATEITTAEDRLQRVEQMLENTEEGESRDLLAKLATVCRRTLAATIVRCCVVQPSEAEQEARAARQLEGRETERNEIALRRWNGEE